MSEEDLRNRCMAAILNFDWSHDRDNQKNNISNINNNNSEDKEVVA